MTKNSLFYDENSRYNNVDNTNIVFLTPKQVFDLDIGFDPNIIQEDEWESLFPFLVDTLKEMVKETTLGDVNGSEIKLPVEGSDCKMYVCVEVNGKLCKLQSEECDINTQLFGLPLNKQIKVFQRLISENQITLNDLAAEDIDNSVFKKLVINDLDGAEVCREKINKIDKWVDEQSKQKKFVQRKQKMLKMLDNN